MIDRLVEVQRSLLAADADAVPEALTGVLAAEYGITDVEVYLVDYRLASLLPLVGGAPVTHPGDPAWRSFDHQAEVTAGHAVFVPLTIRGERVGVLRCAPAPADPERRAELAEIARMATHELQAAAIGTDRYTMAARVRRLTLAAEMQWELLPGRSRIASSFSLAGQLEPSYAVRGDSFDWAEHEGRLQLSVLNGMGDGVPASLLTALVTHALRNARRAGISLADQAGLADQAVYAQRRGETHVAALLLELDPRTGELLMVDAGSPQLLLLRDGAVQLQELEAQFPLGMFESTEYTAQRLMLRPGDRLMVVSDGISDATTAAGRYGEAALHRFIRRTRSMEPLQAVRSLLGDLRTFIGDSDLEDDAVAVCLDWTGPA